MRIMIRSFENLEKHHFLGLTRDTRKIGLPESRVLYTVLRSPHIDKKSREQFEMEIKTKFLVIKTETHELRNKLFRLKYLELNMKFVFLARPVRIKENSRDCFDYRLLILN
uniref:Ribosomal protein S10 n=1 Tax=Gastrodia elata TaxID=91201 RepID=A0A2P1EF75_9ASPA|nr:ribosomal protein S10 [Gastrodia elata]WOE91471.1 ribosomal protein S10 [Gastrodia elata]